MKKLFASVGLVAIGAASAHAQYAPGLTPLEMSKAWSVSAELRGFYDDNYLTLPKGLAEHSWGTEISPSASVNHSVQDTLFSASYMYDLRWYEDHSVTDQAHEFNGRLEHEFSDRFKLSINESFVVAQEPNVLDSTVVSSPLRIEGNNVRNTGQLDFTVELTKLLDLHMGYANTVYAYQQHAGDVIGYNTSVASPINPYAYAPGYLATTGFVPSRSAALDRMEQLATVDLRWKATPDTTGVFGYQYENVNYTSPELIIYPNASYPGGAYSNVRNEDDHFAFIGADHSFTPNLNGSIRVGGEYVDYYKIDTSRLSPYVDANLTWQYTPLSSAQVGVKHIHNSTDVTGATTPVLDTDATAVYASVNHKITDQFTVNAMGQAQYSTFVGGDYYGQGSLNGRGENFYVLGINLAYHFNPWFMTEAGYNYSKLNSDVYQRGYTRNMVYLGFRASY
ncbi:MAG TPA: outer membrane beta-barrel protein [Verrucomicrobiae bacterium]|jgi:hypothetical protein|nr:outer membrane beta-barrel protein [Verrucomicrobiae bacterium]